MWNSQEEFYVFLVQAVEFNKSLKMSGIKKYITKKVQFFTKTWKFIMGMTRDRIYEGS